MYDGWGAVDRVRALSSRETGSQRLREGIFIFLEDLELSDRSRLINNIHKAEFDPI